MGGRWTLIRRHVKDGLKEFLCSNTYKGKILLKSIFDARIRPRLVGSHYCQGDEKTSSSPLSSKSCPHNNLSLRRKSADMMMRPIRLPITRNDILILRLSYLLAPVAINAT